MSRKDWTDEKLFIRLLNNKTQKTYWNYISELRKRANEDVFQRACELARSVVDREKIIGIDILAQLGFNPRFKPKETIELYFQLLKDAHSNKVLSSIFYGIGHNNDHLTKDQVSILATFKAEKNADVRQSLLSALLGIGHSKAIQTLIEFMDDEIVSIRNWATFGIGTRLEVNDIEIINALWKRTADFDQETRYEAIVGLAKRSDSRVKDIIFHELENQNYGTLLFDAIGIMNDKDFLPLLEENLKLAENDDSVNSGWKFALQGIIEELKKQ